MVTYDTFKNLNEIQTETLKSERKSKTNTTSIPHYETYYFLQLFWHNKFIQCLVLRFQP